jgi:hypothetical protein
MAEAKKRGRKRLSEAEKAKRSRFTIAIATDMKARLDASAQANGRTLNSEVYTRLSRSLSSSSTKVMGDAFGGDRTFFTMMLLAEVITSVENTSQPVAPSEREKGKWLDDPFIFQKVREGIEEVLRQIEPKGKAKPPPNMLTPPEHLGAGNALGTLDGLRLAASAPPRYKIDEDGVSHTFSDQLKRFPLIKAALGKDVISRIGKKK